MPIKKHASGVSLAFEIINQITALQIGRVNGDEVKRVNGETIYQFQT